MRRTFIVARCSHITRKRDIYHYRRRLPGTPGGEVCPRLGALQFREVEHRAPLLDGVFEAALRRLASASHPQETPQQAQASLCGSVESMSFLGSISSLPARCHVSDTFSMSYNGDIRGQI